MIVLLLLEATNETTDTERNYFIGYTNITNPTYIISPISLVVISVSAESQYVIESLSGVIESGTAQHSVPTQIALSSSFLVGNAHDWNKGIHVKIQTSVSTEVQVTGYNCDYNAVSESCGSFLALECSDEQDASSYTYYAVTPDQGHPANGAFVLVVGCQDNTTVTITPSEEVTIPEDLQDASSALVNVSSGEKFTLTLTSMQTLLLQAGNLTGTKLVTDKPVSVFSGYDCAQDIIGDTCDHAVEQLPSTDQWGTLYLSGLSLSPVADYYVLVASEDSTSVNITCHSISEDDDFFQSVTVVEMDAGETSKYSNVNIAVKTGCTFLASSPIMVVEFTQVYVVGEGTCLVVLPPSGLSANSSYLQHPQLPWEKLTFISVYESGNLTGSNSALVNGTDAQQFSSTFDSGIWVSEYMWMALYLSNGTQVASELDIFVDYNTPYVLTGHGLSLVTYGFYFNMGFGHPLKWSTKQPTG